MKKIVIVGAGPAGLTAAYELLKADKEIQVTVLEESDTVGGISRTVQFQGNRMDIGGHRFFSKDREVMDWWEKMMPVQGADAFDDKQLHREKNLKPGGPDPEQEDRVMLLRQRVSRIYYNHKFFDYPISLKWQTLKNMGFFCTIKAGFSYLAACLHKREESSLENFYCNRFGKVLYSMFFEGYTEKLWGRHPREISSEWGAQRVKGLSIMAILKDMVGKLFGGKNRKVETSLIEEFWYPKYGPGQLWETVAEEVEKAGGKILFDCRAEGFEKSEDGKISAILYERENVRERIEGDVFLSSMPVKDLIAGMSDVPRNIYEAAQGLPYRDFVTVGLLVPALKLKNETKIKTLNDIVPDCWIYVKELVDMGVLNSASDVISYHRERVKKAYPAYFDTYDQIDEIRAWLDKCENLYCIGRNGQHRYNNMDHSMATAFEAVRNILTGRQDKSNVWGVNTEQEYHEERK